MVTKHEDEAPEARRRRRGAVAILFWAAVLRFGVNNAMFFLFALWCKARIAGDATSASNLTGVIFAATSIGMGVSAMAAGRWVRAGREKGPMVVIPLLAAPAIAAMGFVEPQSVGGAWVMGLLAFATAAGFASAAPLAISVAQRLMPGATGMASSLMMGGAWATSAAFPYAAQWAIARGGLEAAFYLMGGILLLNALVSMMLPGGLLRETADH